MEKLAEDIVAQLFTDAHTTNIWLPKNVSDQMLQNIYDLMKFGPTSANSCPARIVFVRNESPEKEKLIATLAPPNVVKVQGAPVTAIIAFDEKFYEQLPKLYPVAPNFKDMFSSNAELAKTTAFRNSSLQGGYFIIAARLLGLDCGPMSGFDNSKLDEAFFKGTSLKSNFICNIGYGDKNKAHPRLPRLSFEEACKVV